MTAAPGPIEFDPNVVPLVGTHLVEASAGTGKTHGLTALFVRLVAEGGLSARQIAVVTFTEAATRELRTRVRERLIALLAKLDGANDASHADEQLDVLAARLGRDADARRRVRDAIAELDDATISTIHGFARRVLQDFALEAGAPFATLEPGDGTLVVRGAVADFWRREVHASEPAVASWLLDQCVSPDTLGKWLEEPLRVGFERIEPDVDPARLATLETQLEVARQAGRAHVAAIPLEQQALEGSDLLFRDKGKPKKPFDELGEKAHALVAWLTDETRRLTPPVRALFCFTQAGIDASSKKGKRHATQHPALLDWTAAALPIALEQSRLRRAAFIRRAAQEVRERVDAILLERRTTSFDTIILDLARLVTTRGREVVDAVRARYRVAIVDEFQDTDAEQYDIFRALFHGRRDGALFLIGDPKQAIYRFRGGDVFAYRRAAIDAGANRWTLSRNFRSDPALIEAVNALFDPSRAPEPFVHDFIEFRPSTHGVAASAKERVLAPSTTPLVAWAGAAGSNKEAINAALFRAIASEILALLREHAKPPTIAILVRDRHELKQCVAELSLWNIPASANTTERVYDSDEANELRVVLEALNAPRDLRRARAALATDALGYDEAALLALGADGAFEPALALLERLREAAIDQGPAALARAVAQHAGERWLRRNGGRRKLTNLLHLGTLLQSRWTTIDGLAALIGCLEREREAKDEQGELRPDHGGAPVEVLTIHKSKGLQWDVVFAPTLYAGKEQRVETDEVELAKRTPVSYHAADGSLRVDAGSDAWTEHARQHATELRAEQVRLAYVALTRARHRAYTWWGASPVSACSPLVRLLHPDGIAKVSDAAARAGLDAWASASGGAVDVRDLPLDVLPQHWAPPRDDTPIEARSFRGSIDRSFRLSSFSSLFGGANDEAPDYDANVVDATPAVPGPVPGDPRGAAFGEFVHAVLERVPFDAIATEEGRAAIDRLGRDHGYGERAVGYVRTLAAVTANAEIAPGIVLGALPRRALKPELEFFFPLDAVRLDDVAAALALDPRYARTPEEFAHLAPRWAGLMHGYVDLVYAHAGRAGLIDYKTNYLGSRYEDYLGPSLDRAVRSHDYDLQYLIYTVACVRHLRLRDPRFDYDRQFDGVAYLFVRGLPGGTGVFRDKPPRAVVEALDRAFAGGARRSA